jgi:hypothetical protein
MDTSYGKRSPNLKIRYRFDLAEVCQNHLVVPVVAGNEWQWCLIEPENCDQWSGDRQFKTVAEAIESGKASLECYLSELQGS